MISRRNRISLEDKKRLVAAFEKEEDFLRLADQLNIKRGSAKSVVYRTLNRDGVIEKKRGGAPHKKVDEEMKTEIVRIVEENSAITMREINEALRVRLPNKNPVTESTLCNTLEGQLLSLKAPQASSAQRNTADVKAARRDFANWLLTKGHMADQIVYIDEWSYYIWTKRTFGRDQIRQYVNRKVADRRGPVLTLKLAISPLLGVVVASFHSGVTTKEVFKKFINEVSSNLSNESIYLIMDNALRHIGVTPSNEQHHVKYLPPDSPMLNPVEEAFSAWKAVVKSELEKPEMQQLIFDHETARQQGLTLSSWRKDLLQEIAQDALSALTVEKCDTWCTHTLTFLPLCHQMADIL